MRGLAIIIGFAVAGAATGADAQSRADCEAGISFIKGELEKATDASKRSGLAKALRDAERELGEGEYDECMDAVDDAKAVLGPVTEEEKGPQNYPRLRGRIEVELQNDYVYRNRPIGRYNDLFTDTVALLRLELTPTITVRSTIHLEPLREPAGSRFMGDEGLYLEELYLQYERAAYGVAAGKFNPGFGIAWAQAPGIYGDDFAEDYELHEGLGLSGFRKIDAAAWGHHRLGANLFFFDDTSLSNAAFTRPSFGDPRAIRFGRNERRFGGAGNTGEPTSFSLTLDGDGIALLPGLGYHLGVRRLDGADESLAESGYVGALTYAVPLTGEIRFRGVAEYAYFQNFRGSARDNAYTTVAGQIGWLGWRIFASYAQRRFANEQRIVPALEEDGEAGTGAHDRLYSAGFGYTFDIGLSLDIAWRRERADGAELDGIGTLVAYRLSF